MIIKEADQLSLELLTSFLVDARLLEYGSVTAFTIHPDQTTPFSGSRITHIKLEFSKGASIKISSQLVLKIGTGPKEGFFYQNLLPQMKGKIAPENYYSQFDAASNTSNYLLEDLSQSHWQTQWPLPPSLDDCRSAVMLLARLHAHWWDSPFLQQDFQAMFPGGKWWRARIDLGIKRMDAFLYFMGDRLSTERSAIYQTILASTNQSWKPGQGSVHATLLHGDAHFWNFMFPHDSKLHPLLMIDWNSWDVGRATDDLAYMLALHWYPERRARFELPLLQDYHRKLLECGVSGYGFDEFLLDYRQSVIMNMFIPVWQWERGIHPSVWWSHLERSFLAFDDWKCIELL